MKKFLNSNISNTNNSRYQNFKKSLLLFSVISCISLTTACSSGSEGNSETTTEVTTEANTEATTQDANSSASSQGAFYLPQFAEMTEGEQIAIMNTNHGDIKIRFFPEFAPKAVENFLTHAQNGYYDGLTFHRIIDEFMIQGGDPNGIGTGGESIWGADFEDEFTYTLRHFNGALSMANSGANTNGSQFFIVQNSALYPDYITEFEIFMENQDSEVEGIVIKDIYPTEVCEAYVELGGTPHLDGGHTVFGHVYEGMDIVNEIAKVEVDGSSMPIEPVIINTIEVVGYSS